ncbi:MAG: hypothetical protein ACK5TQ_10505, partial [Acetobacteraceae bacterium]
VRASSACASVGKEITRRSAIILFLASGPGGIRHAAGQGTHAGTDQGQAVMALGTTLRLVSIRSE